MTETFIIIIFILPLYLVLIWTYFNPEESMLFGKRWMYREDPEFSNAAVAYIKFASVLAMLLLTITVASLIFESYLIRLLLVLALFLYIIYSVFKLRKKVLN